VFTPFHPTLTWESSKQIPTRNCPRSTHPKWCLITLKLSYLNQSYILIHLSVSVSVSVCLSEHVHSDPLIVSVRPILQPPDKNEISKWAALGLKCSSARCGSWWRRDTHSLDPSSPRTSHRSRY
jgi:hypothetical protein